MSGTDDCASQEIEASSSSNSTRNSKKYSFLRSILNEDSSPMLCSYDPRYILPEARVPRLPLLEKKDFIRNWIVAHSNNAVSPEKSLPVSPSLGVNHAKRSPRSPILGYRWKRIKREASSKESCRISLNERFQQAGTDSAVTARIKIENENQYYSEPGALDCSNSDLDKTLTIVQSPELNEITNSPTLYVRGVSCRFSWVGKTKNSAQFDGDSTLKCNDRRSLVRETLTVQEALSLSSPLGERNERLKKKNRSSELLVEESPFEVEIISSSSKIPETLSLSTTVDEYEGTEVKSKTTYELKEDVNINKLEREHRKDLCLNTIKFKEEPSYSHDRRHHVRESSNSLDRLSMPSPLRIKKLTGVNSKNNASLRAISVPVKFEAEGTSQGIDSFSKIQEFSMLPNTSESLQLGESSVLGSLNSANLELLAKNVPVSVKFVNTPWIRAKNSRANFKTVVSARYIDHPIKSRECSKLPTTLSVLSELGESGRVEVESNVTNAPEDDIKIESDSETTVSDLIENVETQNVTATALRNVSSVAKSAGYEERRPERLSKTRQDRFCDSDETYFSDGDSISRLRPTEIYSLKSSQQISQSTSNGLEARVSANRSEIRISPVASPIENNNFEPPANVTLLNTAKNINKRKRKGKKGSLVAKLQNIVTSQISNLRIWRYQMSQLDFKKSCKHFVMLKIRERETRYGRYYLTASVYEDSHNLLKSLFESQNNLPSKKSESSSEINTVTLVMVPEIIGVVKIRAESTLKIYPPWEVMDEVQKILNVMFFNVIAAEEVNVENKTVIIRKNKRVIEEFECPCIRANTLVDSCHVKFSNTKPSVMQLMFDS